MAEKFNAGTMKTGREARLSCEFRWRRKARCQQRPRKRWDDERAASAVDQRTNFADRRRTFGHRVSARRAGTARIRGSERFLGRGRTQTAFERAVRRGNLRHSNAGRGEWSGSTRLDSE